MDSWCDVSPDPPDAVRQMNVQTPHCDEWSALCGPPWMPIPGPPEDCKVPPVAVHADPTVPPMHALAPRQMHSRKHVELHRVGNTQKCP